MMLRLWPLPILLFLALPLRAQDDDSGESPGKEEPFISVKVEALPSEEGAEPSVAPATAKKEVVPTATLMKGAVLELPGFTERTGLPGLPEYLGTEVRKTSKKGPSAAKGVKFVKGKKDENGEKAAPVVVKTQASVVIAVDLPPPPLPIVPLTPITPRNP